MKPPDGPMDANDVLRATGEVHLTGDPIDPDNFAPAVSLEAYREKRHGRKAAAGVAPPGDEVPMPDDDGDGPGGSRPRIVISAEEAEVNRAAVAALARVPGVYVRGNALVRVLKGQQGRARDAEAPTIDLIPREIVQEHLAAGARFIQLRHGRNGIEEIHQHPPRWCVGAVHTRGHWPDVPSLSGVVEVPVLRRDGTVLGTEGYDRASGLLLEASSRPLVPVDKPSAADVRAALVELEEVVCDFEFALPAHRSTWLASVLTPLARAAFHGPSPLFLYEASVPGTGKGLLVSCSARIATGRSPAIDTYSTDDDEMRKQLVSWASSGRNVVVLDEVTGRLDGATLRSALTGETIAGRLLGLSKNWSGPNLITWFATGNNVAKGKEMFRRIAPVMLTASVEDPSKRVDFKHRDLGRYVAERQPELTRAALTILRGFCAAGRPDQALPGWGSFESWSALVRASIVWAGWPDPAEATLSLHEEDTKQIGHRALAEHWPKLVSLMNRGPVTARDAVRHVTTEPSPLPELRAVLEEVAPDKDGKPSGKVLGYLLRSLKGAVLPTSEGPVRFVGKPAREGAVVWRTEKVGARAEGMRGMEGMPPAPTQMDNPNALRGDRSPPSTPSPPLPPSPSLLKEEKTEKDPILDDWGWPDDEP